MVAWRRHASADASHFREARARHRRARSLSAPVGLDLRANTAEETALSILAELVAVATGTRAAVSPNGMDGYMPSRDQRLEPRSGIDVTPWSRDRNLRHQALSEMADRFDAHAEELGPLVTKENGKKLAEGIVEATVPGITLRHNAAQALTDTGIAAEVAPGQWFSTYAEPAGVVGVIVPWNSPVILLIRSLAPALGAGNTVAVKMPGQTALVANLVSQIIAEVESLRPEPQLTRAIYLASVPSSPRSSRVRRKPSERHRSPASEVIAASGRRGS